MEVIGRCPVCQGKLSVSKLQCDHCHIEITGDFEQSRFSYLNQSELHFVELFLANQGNIKVMERELEISYPTVKKQLDVILKKLGITPTGTVTLSREEIVQKVAKGELSIEDAENLL